MLGVAAFASLLVFCLAYAKRKKFNAIKEKIEIFSHSVKETKMLLSRRDGQLQSTIAEDRISLLPPPPDQLP